MTVKIDMEMPKSCLECKFKELFHDKMVFIKQNIKGVECQNIINSGGHYICRLENAEIKKEWERPSWCPLQEVKE